MSEPSKERCRDCGKPLPDRHAPKHHPEYSGHFLCGDCTSRQIARAGMPFVQGGY